MNCDQVRQALSIDARRMQPAAVAHLDACDDCRRYRTAIERTDARVLQAVRAPMRESLAQRIALAQRLRAARWRIGFGIAASAVVAVLALSMFIRRESIDPATPADWGMLMAEHMDHDPLHEQSVDPKALARLQNAMAEVGVTTHGAMPRVLRARLCPLGDQIAVHAVFEVDGKRVTAFMVHKAVGNEDLQFKNWRGELLTVNGGTLGVFADDSVAMRSLMAALSDGVRWHTV